MTPAIERLLQLAEVARTRIQSLSPVADALVYELGEAIREVEAGPWQPIETAPKDGTQFLAVLSNGWYALLRSPRPFEPKSRYQYWTGTGETPPIVETHPDSTEWGERYIILATHWMPLPEHHIEDRRRENGE